MLLVSCVKHETSGPVPEAADIEGVQWYLKAVTGSPISQWPMINSRISCWILLKKENNLPWAICERIFCESRE